MRPRPARHQVNVRVDETTARRLEWLARRLALNEASVVRLAIARLAQMEGMPEEPSSGSH